MITSNAEAIDRLKQLLDNIDDEIETHVRERDFFIVSLTNATTPNARFQAEQHVSTETAVIHILSTLIHRSMPCPCGMCDRSAREYEKSRSLEGMLMANPKELQEAAEAIRDVRRLPAVQRHQQLEDLLQQAEVWARKEYCKVSEMKDDQNDAGANVPNATPASCTPSSS
jgi:hypothetical protein